LSKEKSARYKNPTNTGLPSFRNAEFVVFLKLRKYNKSNIVEVVFTISPSTLRNAALTGFVLYKPHNRQTLCADIPLTGFDKLCFLFCRKNNCKYYLERFQVSLMQQHTGDCQSVIHNTELCCVCPALYSLQPSYADREVMKCRNITEA
jgi:hypothetical protein